MLALNPWAYWKLNEANGATTCTDSSGHGRDLAPGGVVALGSTGLLPTTADTAAACSDTTVSTAATFAAKVGSQYTDPVLSVEVWLSTVGSSSHTTMGLFSTNRISAGTGQFLLELVSGKPTVLIWDAGGVLHTYSPAIQALTTGATFQLVTVYDGSNLLFYINGALVNTTPGVATMRNVASDGPYVGQPLGGGGSRGYTGTIGPVIVYNSVLTGANVATLYNNATKIPPS